MLIGRKYVRRVRYRGTESTNTPDYTRRLVPTFAAMTVDILKKQPDFFLYIQQLLANKKYSSPTNLTSSSILYPKIVRNPDASHIHSKNTTTHIHTNLYMRLANQCLSTRAAFRELARVPKRALWFVFVSKFID